MSDQNKLEILRVISKTASLGNPERFSFNSLTKTLSLSKEDLDVLLTELKRNRFITEYKQKGVDGFIVTLAQKGLDAVEDESFI